MPEVILEGYDGHGYRRITPLRRSAPHPSIMPVQAGIHATASDLCRVSPQTVSLGI